MADEAFFIRRGSRVNGPFPGAVIQKAISNKQVVATDTFSVSRDGPWFSIQEFPRALVAEAVQGNITANAQATAAPVSVRPANTQPQPASAVTSPKRSKDYSWVNTAVPAVVAGIPSLALGLLMGYVLFAPSGTSSSSVHVAPPAEVQAAKPPREAAKPHMESSEQPSVAVDPGVSAEGKAVPESPQSNSDAIQSLVRRYFGSNSLKEAYACVVPDDAALRLMSDSGVGASGFDGVLSFAPMPPDEELEDIRGRSGEVKIEVSLNAKPRLYYIRFADGGWRIDYMKSWKVNRGLDKEFPLVITVQVHRNATDRRTAPLRVSGIIGNQTAGEIAFLGEFRCLAGDRQISALAIDPGKSQKYDAAFIGEQLMDTIQNGTFQLEIKDVVYKELRMDIKEMCPIKVVVDDHEFDNVILISPHCTKVKYSEWENSQ